MEATGNEGRCASVIAPKPSRASLSRSTKTDSVVGREWAIILRILRQMTRTSSPRRFPQKAHCDGWHRLNLTVGHMRQPLLSPSLHLFLPPKSSVSMKRPEDAISSSLSLCQAAILRGSSLLNSA
ncbi:unnamed protein product [Leuciscus chuanchicus]